MSETNGLSDLLDEDQAVKYDPILLSMVRRSLPNLIAYDLCGVQPMTAPNGQIFSMSARYENYKEQLEIEALLDKVLGNEST